MKKKKEARSHCSSPLTTSRGQTESLSIENTLLCQVPVTLHSREENATYFPMPGEVLQAKVTKANLWFYVNHSSDDTSDVIRMRVDLLVPTLSQRQPRLSEICIWKHAAQPQKTAGWHSVDLTPVVQRWVKNPASNYGLKIVALEEEENVAILYPSSAADSGYEPTLDIVITHQDSKRRHRRSDSLFCTENSTEHRCCRYPLTLSFVEYGWDWVISPTHVEVGYCSGECRMTLQNKTPHSWLLAQARGSGSCCTPSKMMAMPLLYFNHEGAVVYQLLQDIRVERCGCA